MNNMKSPVYVFLFLVVLSVAFIPGGRSIQTQPNMNSISINADGTFQPADAPLTSSGDVYTFMGNFSGGLEVHTSNIVIDGAGYALKGEGILRSAGIDLSNNVTSIPGPDNIWNVTIKNLAIINFDFSINTSGGGNDTICNDYIANTASGLQGGVFFWACGGNNVSYCTINGDPAVYMHFCSSGNTITHNNLRGGISLEIGGSETVDSNYFAEYTTMYPNASQIGSTGVWDTPYSYNSSYESLIEDFHPRVNPIAISIFPSGIPTPVETKAPATPPSQTSSDPTFRFGLFVALPFVAAAGLGSVFVIRRRGYLQKEKVH
jgi:hypothetical protein